MKNASKQQNQYLLGSLKRFRKAVCVSIQIGIMEKKLRKRCCKPIYFMGNCQDTNLRQLSESVMKNLVELECKVQLNSSMYICDSCRLNVNRCMRRLTFAKDQGKDSQNQFLMKLKIKNNNSGHRTTPRLETGPSSNVASTAFSGKKKQFSNLYKYI